MRAFITGANRCLGLELTRRGRRVALPVRRASRAAAPRRDRCGVHRRGRAGSAGPHRGPRRAHQQQQRRIPKRGLRRRPPAPGPIYPQRCPRNPDGEHHWALAGGAGTAAAAARRAQGPHPEHFFWPGLPHLESHRRPCHYSASKAALNMYMRNLAADIGHQGLISVLVAPGWMRTSMGGRHRHLGTRRLGPRHHYPLGRAASRRGERQFCNLAEPVRPVVKHCLTNY